MPSEAQQLLWLVVLQDVVFALLTVAVFWAGIFVARRLGSRARYSLAALGLVRPKGGLFAGARLGLLVGLGILVMSWAVGALSVLVLESLGYSAKNTAQDALIRGLRGWVGEDPAFAIPAAAFVVVLFVPLVEELVFRGAIFGGLYRLGLLVLRKTSEKGVSPTARWTALVPAALFSSVAFALLHLSPVVFPALLVLAVVLCVLYERSGSLLPTFVAHATFNSFATLLIILSGLGALPY